MKNDLYKRVARTEAMANAQRAESEEALRGGYQRACEAKNEEEAAEFARRLRNKLLDSSDKQMSLDRLSLDTASATKFITSLKTIFTGDWAKYRQSLRDIPQQKGFPFDVEFPTEPDKEER